MSVPIVDTLIIDNKVIDTIVIPLLHANLVMAVAPKGFIMCGYLSIEAAEKISDVACIVTGVETVEDLLNATIQKLTSQAQQLGIEIGDSALVALQKML